MRRIGLLSAEFCGLIPLHGARPFATEGDISANMSKLKVLRDMMDMCEGVHVRKRLLWTPSVVSTAPGVRAM